MSRYMVFIGAADCKDRELAYVYANVDSMNKHLLELRSSEIITDKSYLFVGKVSFFGISGDYFGD